LPFAFFLLPFAFFLLPFAFCLLPSFFCLLSSAFCLFSSAFCLLSFAFFLLPFAFFLLPLAFSLASVPKPIPYSRFRNKQRGLGGVVFYFLAQLGYEYPEVLGLAGIAVSPDLVEYELVG